MVKIKHFQTEESQQTAPPTSSDGIDRSRLSLLYFRSKSIKERFEEDEQREKLRRKRLPRAAYAVDAFWGALLATIILFYAQNVVLLWYTANFGMILISFAIWLALFGLVYLWVKKLHATLFAYGKSVYRFWAGYVLIVCIALVVIGVGWPLLFTQASSSLYVGAGYYIILTLYLLAVLKIRNI